MTSEIAKMLAEDIMQRQQELEVIKPLAKETYHDLVPYVHTTRSIAYNIIDILPNYVKGECRVLMEAMLRKIIHDPFTFIVNGYEFKDIVFTHPKLDKKGKVIDIEAHYKTPALRWSIKVGQEVNKIAAEDNNKKSVETKE